MWPNSIHKTEQESESAAEPEAPAAPDNDEPLMLALEEEPPPALEKQWDSAAEDEWNEHRATAWALAYIIHRVRSTPFPPILLPAQRHHFQKVIEMAAALMEDWQRDERDLAQHLAQERPVTEFSTGPMRAIQAMLSGHHTTAQDEDAPLFTPPPYQLILEDDEKERAEAISKAPDVEQDYQI